VTAKSFTYTVEKNEHFAYMIFYFNCFDLTLMNMLQADDTFSTISSVIVFYSDLKRSFYLWIDELCFLPGAKRLKSNISKTCIKQPLKLQYKEWNLCSNLIGIKAFGILWFCIKWSPVFKCLRGSHFFVIQWSLNPVLNGPFSYLLLGTRKRKFKALAIRAADKVPALQISMCTEHIFWHNFFISSPNPIELHSLELSWKDDSNEW